MITGGDCVTGHDPATGAELWRANGLNPDNDPFYRIIASPVIFNDIIYAPTRVRPLLALKAGGRGDISSSHVLWSTVNGPDVPTPVTDGKYFYVVNDRGIMWCLDAKTGQEIYGQQRIKPGTYSASPVLADDKIYVTNEDGLTTVVKAGPKFRSPRRECTERLLPEFSGQSQTDKYLFAQPVSSSASAVGSSFAIASNTQTYADKRGNVRYALACRCWQSKALCGHKRQAKAYRTLLRCSA